MLNLLLSQLSSFSQDTLLVLESDSFTVLLNSLFMFFFALLGLSLYLSFLC